ncbi:MAG: RluA family pseudouridine synthase [Proteobacteria bacterium]|nr:RluA family pseudouridine synthase [Pseudomonadota bacterium]
MPGTIYKISVDRSQNATVSDLLCLASGISKTKIKDAMTKGAVWIKKQNKQKRIRRASTLPESGAVVELYYDEALLDIVPEKGTCIKDEKHYSVWFKPSGLMSQGTLYGDHASVLRQAELFFENKRPVFPVNRLDRETAGLILLAHSKKAAAALSSLFQERRIKKTYLAMVKGHPGHMEDMGEISFSLDGKRALTRFRTIRHDPSKDVSLVDICLDTGRFHQIRRHFDMIGCPVMGDPRYGKGNKNKDGLKLFAHALEFTCPITGKTKSYHENPASFFQEGLTSPLSASTD